MTEADRRGFSTEMAKLAAAFKTQLTEPLLAAYWDEFADVSIEDFRRACSTTRRTKDFMPTIRELRSAAGPRRPPAQDPLWARGLTPWEPTERWPEGRLLGTADFPAPRPEPQPESAIERAARERLLRMHDER